MKEAGATAPCAEAPGCAEVVLVHGLWAPDWVMVPLAARLARAGFRCHRFRYAGRARPLESHLERLARYARAIGRAHFVGHSLGGLVVLETLERERTLAAGRVLLLGAPVRGSLAARRGARLAPGRWLLGEAASILREERPARWTRAEPLGVVAGSLPLGIGRFLGGLPGPSDGVVRVEETTVEGMCARIVLPVSHSTMLVSARLAREAAAFLATGRFGR
jgi:pimeloyl-ACP methyl ester carboxylesterase